MEERLDIERNDDRTRRLDWALELRNEQRRQSLQAAYRSQFDSWVISQFRTRDEVRPRLERLLAAQIRELTARCRLRDEQSRKLELAGQGEIKRFIDRFEYVAGTIEGRNSTIDELRAARAEMRHLGMPAPSDSLAKAHFWPRRSPARLIRIRRPPAARHWSSGTKSGMRLPSSRRRGRCKVISA